MIRITRFPFVFWGMKNEPDAVINGDCIIKGDKKYTVKPSSIWIFLLTKYLLIVIGLFIVFTKYDFEPTLEKFLQYAVALVLIFLTLSIPKKFMTLFLIIVSISTILAIVFGKLDFVSFIFKYCIVFFIFFIALLDSKKKHYYVFGENKKIIANIITED